MPIGGGGGGAPAVTYFSIGQNSGGAAINNANNVPLAGFVLPVPLTFSHISVNVNTADATGTYDFGIYNFAGTLRANIGGAAYTTTGIKTLNTLQGVQTLSAGLYMFGWTGTAIVLQLVFDAQTLIWCNPGSAGVGVSGTLPATVTPQSVGAFTHLPQFALF